MGVVSGITGRVPDITALTTFIVSSFQGTCNAKQKRGFQLSRRRFKKVTPTPIPGTWYDSYEAVVRSLSIDLPLCCALHGRVWCVGGAGSGGLLSEEGRHKARGEAWGP